jgi:hypothetical protein
MTLLEKITREIPNARVEPAELHGHPAWRITLARADSTDGGTFEALVYKEAARVQIRHLDAYKEARYAIAVLQGHPPRSGPSDARGKGRLARDRSLQGALGIHAGGAHGSGSGDRTERGHLFDLPSGGGEVRTPRQAPHGAVTKVIAICGVCGTWTLLRRSSLNAGWFFCPVCGKRSKAARCIKTNIDDPGDSK